ncbi:unnamed protein product [Rotaria sp. Silwood2]|nr:unnamed protein product [Rotaria sp. Silwood2]
MYQIKRQSSFSEFLNVENKKLRTFSEDNISITSIENLSNELFYEIFEYLDGYDIYKTFCNLNSRFQYLITCSSISFNIKLCSNARSEVKHCCKTVIIPNIHRILSLNLEDESLINDFFKHCIINSSFHRLQSIVLNCISIDRAVVLLFFLKSLPHLFSLTMHIEEEWNADLSNIYRMIFSLSSLKYNKLSLFQFFGVEDANIFVPLALNEQFSTIEYLIISHICTLSELMSILYHTPQLRHLICDNLVESDSNVQIEQSITLSNLVYIRINVYHIDFDEFEMFMKIFSQLQVLHITQEYGKAYLDADRWKRLITKHMSHLCRFNYQYSEYDYNTYEDTILDVIINRFTSPFWVDRGWIFELEISIEEISFLIHPYKKTWFEFEERTENITYSDQHINPKSIEYLNISSRKSIDNVLTKINPIIELLITGCSSQEQNQTFIDDFKSTFVSVQFTHLSINFTLTVKAQ